jgi:hypothetical protein
MRTSSRITPLTPQRRRARPSPLLLLVLLLALLVVGIYFLSTLAGEVPTGPIEVDVTNAAGR